MYIKYNPNPEKKIVDDCVIRAICKVTGKSWNYIYWDLCAEGAEVHDWPWRNYVWGRYLTRLGFVSSLIPNTCPYCYTVRDFCIDNPYGDYILATGNHVIAVVDGDYYDVHDSGDEVPVYVWKRKEL